MTMEEVQRWNKLFKASQQYDEEHHCEQYRKKFKDFYPKVEYFRAEVPPPEVLETIYEKIKDTVVHMDLSDSDQSEWRKAMS